MIIYNVTVSIDVSVADEWLTWMKETHIPDVMNTGLFSENKILRVHAEEEGGKTYSIQYTCDSMEVLEQYQSIYSPKLQQAHNAKYQGKFAAFRTILEIVHQQ